MDFVPIPKTRLWKSKADFFRPFRTAAAEAGENIVPLYDPSAHHAEPEEPDLRDLNAALAALVDIFPAVEPEVFREMLLSVSPESRLQIVTEQLLSKKAKWTRGRFRTASKASEAEPLKLRQSKSTLPEASLAEEDTFRSDSYKRAVKQVFYQEFKSLSHSSIKAVLAEQNFSYNLSRPILQQLSSRSWRFSFASIWSRRAASTTGDHPYVIWPATAADQRYAVPSVRRTGSVQLDRELYDLFISAIAVSKRREALAEDQALADQLNEKEAEEADALFDCDCCFGSVTFESTATCNDECHQLCFDCIRRTISEALFGQGWSRTIDLERSTVRCFAPATCECRGIIPPEILRRALSTATDKENLWNDLQDRAAGEAVLKSRLPLQRCPFCSYAEVNETPIPHRRTSTEFWHHAKIQSTTFQLMLILTMAALLIFTVPVVTLFSMAWLFIQIYPPFLSPFRASWTRVHRLRRGLKFKCLNPTCRTISCVRCLTAWRDPHICFENEKTSLRTAIESSATAAVKRTCPRCLLSFVKSSGCNKLVCNCGYAMCYICRQEITSKEGYGHFCQHFRPHGGRCVECDRCDLYGDEDEEAAIRRAAEEAEKIWREKEGRRDGDETATQAMVEALVGQTRTASWWERGLDAVVDAMIK